MFLAVHVYSVVSFIFASKMIKFTCEGCDDDMTCLLLLNNSIPLMFHVITAKGSDITEQVMTPEAFSNTFNVIGIIETCGTTV